MAFGVVGNFAIDITTRDRDGNRARNTWNYPLDALLFNDFTQARDTALATIQLQAAISDAIIEKATLRFEIIDPVLEDDIPVVGTDVERKGVFTFRLSNRQAGKFEVPSIRQNLLNPGSNDINTSEATVAAFVTQILNGPFGPNNGAQTAGGAQYERLLKAYKAHRTSDDG